MTKVLILMTSEASSIPHFKTRRQISVEMHFTRHFIPFGHRFFFFFEPQQNSYLNKLQCYVFTNLEHETFVLKGFRMGDFNDNEYFAFLV